MEVTPLVSSVHRGLLHKAIELHFQSSTNYNLRIRAQLLYRFPDIIGRYWSIADILLYVGTGIFVLQ